jgi:hypothetical protein
LDLPRQTKTALNKNPFFESKILEKGGNSPEISSGEKQRDYLNERFTDEHLIKPHFNHYLSKTPNSLVQNCALKIEDFN